MGSRLPETLHSVVWGVKAAPKGITCRFRQVNGVVLSATSKITNITH